MTSIIIIIIDILRHDDDNILEFIIIISYYSTVYIIYFIFERALLLRNVNDIVGYDAPRTPFADVYSNSPPPCCVVIALGPRLRASPLDLQLLPPYIG